MQSLGVASNLGGKVTRVQTVSSIGLTCFLVSLAAGVGLTAWSQNPWPVILLGLGGVYLLFSIKVASQWERAAVLRLGAYRGLRGPGLFTIVPIVDTVSDFIDQRIRVTEVKAESTLTRDAVPVFVDAIVFWVVWNAEKSILEVQDFGHAIGMSAQTALRESIGRHMLTDMVTDRESLGRELQKILDQKTNPWGVTVQSVEIRDVQIHRSRPFRPGPDEPLCRNHRQDHRRTGSRPCALGPALGDGGGEGAARHAEERHDTAPLLRRECAHSVGRGH